MSLARRFKDRLRRRWSLRRNQPAVSNDLSMSDNDHAEQYEDGLDVQDKEDEDKDEDEYLPSDTRRQRHPAVHTTTHHRARRPPSPYPLSEFSLAHHRSSTSSRNRYSRPPFVHDIDTPDQGLYHSPMPPDTSLPQAGSKETKDQWLQRAIRTGVRFKDVSQRVISRRFTLIKQGTSTVIKRSLKGTNQGNNNNSNNNNSIHNNNDNRQTLLNGSHMDESDPDCLDLRYFYDPGSEDPINRLAFKAGPEHFFHLALQLETSPQVEFQLYGKDLFIRSATMGYAPAQFKLGICYELGLTHFPMDPSLSFAWYKRAAMQGHADAELAVSGWYLTGHPQGLLQSEPLAYEWASKAAHRGWSKAEYTLGHYHEVGIGVPQDLDIAKQWYIKAASQGNERALLRLLVGHVGLDVDYGHLKDALLDQNHENPYLVHQLAQFHELREYGLVPDEDAAFELYAASAQENYAPAQYRLGACYEFGILGAPRDPVQAVHWYRRGADNGHVEALLALAGFYLDGSAAPEAEQSDQEAFRYVKMAAQRGVPKAEYITGFFLEYGLGVEKNIKEAKQWYHIACAKGVESAERRLMDLDRLTAAAGATATFA